MPHNLGGAWNKYMFADERLNNKRYEFDYGNYWGHENYFYGKSVNITSLEGKTGVFGNMPGTGYELPIWRWKN